jgi:hypothetical protein
MPHSGSDDWRKPKQSFLALSYRTGTGDFNAIIVEQKERHERGQFIPQQQTCGNCIGMSETCQQRKCAETTNLS